MAIKTVYVNHCVALIILYAVASGGGGGTPERSPPPEIGKIVVEMWCYLPVVFTFGAEPEIQEIFSKKL